MPVTGAVSWTVLGRDGVVRHAVSADRYGAFMPGTYSGPTLVFNDDGRVLCKAQILTSDTTAALYMPGQVQLPFQFRTTMYGLPGSQPLPKTIDEVSTVPDMVLWNLRSMGAMQLGEGTEITGYLALLEAAES